MQLILKKYQVELTESGLVKYLTRWGFPKVNREESKQEQCDKTIRKWLDMHLEATIARSINEKAQIYWLGHSGFVNLHAKFEPEKKYYYIPVISNQGRLHWLTITGRFNPKRQVMLLKSLVAQNRVKVFLIRKTATHFNTSLVKEWLLKNQHVLEILPPSGWFNELHGLTPIISKQYEVVELEKTDVRIV